MRLPLIIVLIILSFASISCRKGELIGREVQIGDNDILLKTTDSFHIASRTITAARERTDERFEGMMGAYMDPIFGPSVINFYSQYHLQEEGFVFPQDAVFDSAFVSYRLTGGYREKNIDPETRSFMHLEVYEISQDLYLDSIYFSNQNVRLGPSKIGEFEGMVGLFDSVWVNGNPQPSQIRIKLNDSWGQKMMTADSNFYSSNDAFTQFMKGIAVLPIQTQEASSNGVIFYFNPLSGFSGVTIHYHTPTDTTKFEFIPSNQTAYFTTFHHDYSISPVGSILDDTASGSNKLYIQASIGTDIQIELKDIVAKFGSSPKIINFAELYIPVDTSQNYHPVAKLSVSRKLENGSTEFLPDQVQTGNRDIDGLYDSDSAYYRFRITQYIQEIIHSYVDGDQKSEILLISAFGNNTLANRSVIWGPRPTDPNARKMHIKITYTPL